MTTTDLPDVRDLDLDTLHWAAINGGTMATARAARIELARRGESWWADEVIVSRITFTGATVPEGVCAVCKGAGERTPPGLPTRTCEDCGGTGRFEQ